MSLSGLRVGYVPCSPKLCSPGDRRRFVYFAKKREISFEIADPTSQYDLVILTERADISVWHRYHGARIVFDLIDSYLAIPRTNAKALLRGTAKFVCRQSRYLQLNYWRAIELMCRRADAVVCSTNEQRADILPFCSNVHVVLDIQSSSVQDIKHDYSLHSPARLVWEGLPYTLNSLGLLKEALSGVNKKIPIELHIVTDPIYFRYLGSYGLTDTLSQARKIFPDTYFHEWQEGSLAKIVCSADLAIIPVDLSDPFSFGKPENKLLLFWRMGMPVVASASPAYFRAMSSVGLNLTCRDGEQWINNLMQVLSDKSLRQRAGELGKVYAEQEYSELKLLKAWDRVFESMGIFFTNTEA